MAGQRLAHPLAHRGGQELGEGVAEHVDHHGLVPGGHQIIGEFGADQTSTHHQHARAIRQLFAEFAVVIERVDRDRQMGGIAVDRRPHGVRAQRQNQPVVENRSTGGEQHLAFAVDPLGKATGPQFKLELRRHFFARSGDQGVGNFALGECRR